MLETKQNTPEEPKMDKKTAERCLNVAKGCFDYGGGYAGNYRNLRIYHHGIQTVVNNLEVFLENGDDDIQIRLLEMLGENK